MGCLKMANEKRLVYAQEVKEIFDYEVHSGATDLFDAFDSAIENATTVDAVEVVHGHWCWEGRFRACSECGSYVEFTETLGASHWKYCPNCGAKMDGGLDEAR